MCSEPKRPPPLTQEEARKHALQDLEAFSPRSHQSRGCCDCTLQILVLVTMQMVGIVCIAYYGMYAGADGGHWAAMQGAVRYGSGPTNAYDPTAHRPMRPSVGIMMDATVRSCMSGVPASCRWEGRDSGNRRLECDYHWGRCPQVPLRSVVCDEVADKIQVAWDVTKVLMVPFCCVFAFGLATNIWIMVRAVQCRGCLRGRNQVVVVGVGLVLGMVSQIVLIYCTVRIGTTWNSAFETKCPDLPLQSPLHADAASHYSPGGPSLSGLQFERHGDAAFPILGFVSILVVGTWLVLFTVVVVIQNKKIKKVGNTVEFPLGEELQIQPPPPIPAAYRTAGHQPIYAAQPIMPTTTAQQPAYMAQPVVGPYPVEPAPAPEPTYSETTVPPPGKEGGEFPYGSAHYGQKSPATNGTMAPPQSQV